MADKPHVFLLGDSVIMESVAEGLRKQEFSDLTRISEDSLELHDLLHSGDPDLIVYEVSEKNTSPIYSIISEQPDALHLVIDLDSNHVVLLDCQRKPTGSIQDLCDFVSQEVNEKVSKRRRNGESF